ncbi:hypothetical protein GJ496_001391 [Pomphorhynchus laevis]|nr:hypothetical protein GJ496_001391 [Pomphorhynchus laevis]
MISLTTHKKVKLEGAYITNIAMLDTKYLNVHFGVIHFPWDEVLLGIEFQLLHSSITINFGERKDPLNMCKSQVCCMMCQTTRLSDNKLSTTSCQTTSCQQQVVNNKLSTTSCDSENIKPIGIKSQKFSEADLLFFFIRRLEN